MKKMLSLLAFAGISQLNAQVCFTPRTDYIYGGLNPTSVISVDVNNDGKLDLVSSTPSADGIYI